MVRELLRRLAESDAEMARLPPGERQRRTAALADPSLVIHGVEGWKMHSDGVNSRERLLHYAAELRRRRNQDRRVTARLRKAKADLTAKGLGKRVGGDGEYRPTLTDTRLMEEIRRVATDEGGSPRSGNEIVRILRDERGFAVKRGRVQAFLKRMRGAERDPLGQ